jgi:hypothetical protein
MSRFVQQVRHYDAQGLPIATDQRVMNMILGGSKIVTEGTGGY